MRSDKSRGLYEALQRSRKGMKRVSDAEPQANVKPTQQQAFPFKPPVAPGEPAVAADSSPSADSGMAGSAEAGVRQEATESLPLLAGSGGQSDETGIHGRDERPVERQPTPPSTVNAGQGDQPGEPVETRRPTLPVGGGGPGGIGIGGGRTAPRTDMGGFENWKPLILALMGLLLVLLVLSLLVMGVISMFRPDDPEGQIETHEQHQGYEDVGQAANMAPQRGVLDNTGSRALERGALVYDDSEPPQEPVGEQVDTSGHEHLIPGLSGPFRIYIVTSDAPSLNRVRDFMLRHEIPTRIQGRTLVTEQTFPSAGHEEARRYLERVKSLDRDYSRETGSRTSFQTAYLGR
jgi:hypothetical protein